MGKLPYISRIHTAYIGGTYHFRQLKCLVTKANVKPSRNREKKTVIFDREGSKVFLLTPWPWPNFFFCEPNFRQQWWFVQGGQRRQLWVGWTNSIYRCYNHSYSFIRPFIGASELHIYIWIRGPPCIQDLHKFVGFPLPHDVTPMHHPKKHAGPIGCIGLISVLISQPSKGSFWGPKLYSRMKSIFPRNLQRSDPPTNGPRQKPEYLIDRSQLTERGPLVRSHENFDG